MLYNEVLTSKYAEGGGGCGSVHTGGVEIDMMDYNNDRKSGTRRSLCKHQDQTEWDKKGGSF